MLDECRFPRGGALFSSFVSGTPGQWIKDPSRRVNSKETKENRNLNVNNAGIVQTTEYFTAFVL